MAPGFARTARIVELAAARLAAAVLAVLFLPRSPGRACAAPFDVKPVISD
jgi:hypothetical protein